MNRYPASLANHLSAYGRYGDDQLVHMNRQEVAALDGIAAAFGRELTRNPHTGMKEAFNLFDILPIALSFTGIGAPAAIALSAASGAASAAVEGNDPLQGALMGGISGALGASFGGGADAATKGATDAATKAGTDAATKAATDAATQAAAQAPVGLEFLGTPTAQTATQSLPGLDFLKPAVESPGAFTDIFGPGTDKEVGDALQSIWKKENLPYTIMGGTALSMLPDMFASEGPGRPEYKDIPENFPVSPRMINPDYDPSLSAFGEQNAFSSGVDYLGRGFAEGGEVSKGNDFNPFNIQNMLGGVVPMIIDGFTDGNKYGSGILGMLFNKRKPWEYGKDDSPQGMANAPQMANAPSIPAPGYAYGGQVRRVPGYKGGGRVEYSVAPDGYMWQPSGGRAGGRTGTGGKLGQTLVPDPNYRMQLPERNIQQTNIQGLYSGQSPFISQGMTQIPLPGGQMGAPPQEQQSAPQFTPQDMSSFEIATPPEGGPQMYSTPTSGGGMGAPRAGGKAGGQGGGKVGRSGTVSTTDTLPPPVMRGGNGAAPSGGKAGRPETTFPGRPQQMGGGNGAAPVGQPNAMAQMLGAGTQGTQLYDRFMQTRDAERNNIAQMSGILRGIPTSKPEEQPQINPGLQTGILSTMGPGGAPGQASPAQPEPTQPTGPVGMGAQQGFAMGGMVDRAMEVDDRTVVKEAAAAIMGQSPNPEAAIAMFVERFGEEALQMLMQKVGGGAGQGVGQGRYLEGPGDGLSDSIPAVVDGQQPSALSSGEFVIPADAVSHLGNGDNKSGAKELYNMIDRLRQARTGSPTPPPAIDQRSVMPA